MPLLFCHHPYSSSVSPSTTSSWILPAKINPTSIFARCWCYYTSGLLDHLAYSIFESLWCLIMLIIRFKVIKLILSIVRHPLTLASSLSLSVTLVPLIFSHKYLSVFLVLPCMQCPCQTGLPGFFACILQSSCLLSFV